MNRRQLFAALAAAALAPGELWTPTRSIFLPPTAGWPGLRTGHFIFRDGGAYLAVDQPYRTGDEITITFDGGEYSGYANGELVARAPNQYPGREPNLWQSALGSLNENARADFKL
jgi:hypothetical protein